MLHSGPTPLTGPDTAGAARRTIRALCLPVLVLLAALPFGAALRPAGADTVAGLQARAATVAHDLVLEQLQVDAARQQESVVAARVADDQQAIAALGQQLATDQQAIDRNLRIVQAQAIQSYVNSGADSSGADAALFAGGGSRAQTASEYAQLAVGTLTSAMAQLHTAQRALQAEQAQLQARQRQDRADEARRSAALAQAAAAASQLQAQQAQVTGQLAAAVSAQQAAQAAAAAAAVAAAHKTSAPAATTSTIPVSGPSGPSGPSGVAPAPTPPTTAPAHGPSAGGDPYPALPDPALNSFLTCVVQAESGGNYGIVSPNGLYMGAFQFSQPTWNTAAGAAGLGLLVGVRPNLASKAEQDTVAVALYALDGQQPWLGDRCA